MNGEFSHRFQNIWEQFGEKPVERHWEPLPSVELTSSDPSVVSWAHQQTPNTEKNGGSSQLAAWLALSPAAPLLNWQGPFRHLSRKWSFSFLDVMI